MTDEELRQTVIDAIREEVGDPDVPINGATTAADVPGWDSLAHVRIVFNIGIRLDRDIDPSSTYEAADVDGLVAAVRQAIEGP